MTTKKITNTTIAKELGITPQAISIWKRDNQIPAKSCIDLEPIIKVRARKLFLNPSILFDMFNNNKKTSNTSIPQR